MFSLKRLLNRLTSPSGATHAPPRGPHARRPESLDGRANRQALDILQSLVEHRQLLEVRIDQSEESYQSMLLAVDPHRGLLWLDELTPQCAPLGENSVLRVWHHQQGQVLNLALPVVGDLSGSQGAIAVLLPERVHYKPRRRWHRYTLTGTPLNARVRFIGEQPTVGRVINLSGGGMRLALTGNRLHQLRRDTLLPLCQVSIGGGLQITCKARVKAAQLFRNPTRHTQVSLEFTDTPPGLSESVDAQLRRLECLNAGVHARAA